LEKLREQLHALQDLAQVMALRLAILFYRNRSDVILPAMQGHFSGIKFHLSLAPDWLVQNPLTEMALREEEKRWKELGINAQLSAV
jgi:exopolyphosphatase/guanosine-5'-triphosphate,3'-diphosphate pyrophosphatase